MKTDSPAHGMTLIVKTITRLLVGFIFVFGATTVIYGHLTPGGGFAGGVILACVFILIVLAYGKKPAIDILRNPAAWDAAGSIGITIYGLLLIGFVGGFSLVTWLGHGEPLRLISGGTVLWSNIIIGIKVMAILFAMFLALAVFRPGTEK